MDIHKLEKLEHLLKEYLAENVLGIEKIKLCLDMVQENIAFIEYHLDAQNESELNALENQSPEQ